MDITAGKFKTNKKRLTHPFAGFKTIKGFFIKMLMKGLFLTENDDFQAKPDDH